MNRKSLIIIIEDEEKITRILKLFLESRGFLVRCFEEGNSALDFLIRHDADLVLLDLMLPEGLSGFEIAQKIRKIKTVPIIIITAKTMEKDKIYGFESGGDDYITKPFSLPEVESRIRAQLRRVREYNHSSPTPNEEITKISVGPFEVDLLAHEVKRGEEILSLTPIQLRLFKLFLETPDKVWSREDIHSKLFFDGCLENEIRTIDAHIKNLREIIEIDRAKPQFLQTVWGIGYRFGLPKK